jgi:hypothetical protein
MQARRAIIASKGVALASGTMADAEIVEMEIAAGRDRDEAEMDMIRREALERVERMAAHGEHS